MDLAGTYPAWSCARATRSAPRRPPISSSDGLLPELGVDVKPNRSLTFVVYAPGKLTSVLTSDTLSDAASVTNASPRPASSCCPNWSRPTRW